MKQLIIKLLVCLLGIAFCSSCVFDKALATDKMPKLTEKLPIILLKPLVPSYELDKYSFMNIAALDNGKIWAVGFDGKNSSAIRFSLDSGKTWKLKTVTSKFILFDSIYFADDLHGWIGGSGNIFQTSDGGQNWKQTDLKEYLDFTSLSFYKDQVGYLAGKFNVKDKAASEIWVTRNGGNTWVKSYKNRDWQDTYALLAVSEKSALAILDEKHLIKTDDAGLSWHSIQSFDYSTNKLYKDRNERVWAVGRDGNFFFTMDSGQTWNRPPIFPESLLNSSWDSIAFVDEQHGFAVGEKGSFAETMDGGMTWKPIETSTKENLTQIHLGKNIGFVTGSNNFYQFEF